MFFLWKFSHYPNKSQHRPKILLLDFRPIGVEAARGLARLRLANLVNVHSFQRSESAASLHQREKSYYYDARETHYNRFGPHAWFDPGMRGRTHR